MILFEVFGRDRSWDLCQAHTPFSLAAHQSSKELLLGGVYPGTGGLSGNLAMKFPSADFRDSSEVVVITSLERMFYKTRRLKYRHVTLNQFMARRAKCKFNG